MVFKKYYFLMGFAKNSICCRCQNFFNFLVYMELRKRNGDRVGDIIVVLTLNRLEWFEMELCIEEVQKNFKLEEFEE